MLTATLPEASVYNTTTRMSLGRELGWLAGVMEMMDHPASAARALAAYIRLIEGDHDRVWTALDLIESERFADDAGLDIVLALWSEIVAASRSERHCRRFLDELTPLDGTQIASGGFHLGSAARLMALLHDVLGKDADADELFARAVQEHEALQSPPWLARTHLDWAEALSRRGKLVEVEAHLDAARAAIGALVLSDLSVDSTIRQPIRVDRREREPHVVSQRIFGSRRFGEVIQSRRSVACRVAWAPMATKRECKWLWTAETESTSHLYRPAQCDPSRCEADVVPPQTEQLEHRAPVTAARINSNWNCGSRQLTKSN